ncbi:hypothetical protein ACN20G_14735 [Streptomyces sp. BI20]|uniref:hypothetical protein n=1 Tax=Streptomyces sp. BI20 TaxID=3403460 RepID=UPI003C77FB6B
MLALPVLTGCGRPDGSALTAEQGRAVPRAHGPQRLWPDRPPAAPTGDEDAEGPGPVPVPGLPVPSGDLHDVTALAVLRADLAATRTGDDDCADRADRADTDPLAEALAGCDRHPVGPAAGCAVRPAAYRDLTGDGLDELILGVDLPDGQLDVRVYTLHDGALARIMDTTQRVLSVDLTARKVIIRSTGGGPDAEHRDEWAWCEDRRAMRPRLMEIVRPTDPPRTAAS